MKKLQMSEKWNFSNIAWNLLNLMGVVYLILGFLVIVIHDTIDTGLLIIIFGLLCIIHADSRYNRGD
jgi:hypothetical protein